MDRSINITNTCGKAGVSWTASVEDNVDMEFIQRVQAEVTQSCALPFAVPAERIPEYIIQAAQYFWETCDFAVEERYYIVKNSDICKGNKLNKIVQLPKQVMGVHGAYKTRSAMRYGTMGDFSLERMMMSSYSMFGGVGAIGGGLSAAGNGPGAAGYSLADVVTAMYEVDTFNQTLNAPLTYNYNYLSNKLVLLGDLGSQDILVCCNVRCRIQDLYNSYYFFRYVVALVKKALGFIYGMYEFKLPGGVTINYSKLDEQANDEMEMVKEWIENNKAVDYFFMPNTL